MPVQTSPVRDFQDHDTHIYHHNLFRKSSDYDKLPPEIQQLLDDHVNQHMQALQGPIDAQQQAEQAQQQQMQQQDEEMKMQDQANQQEQLDLQHRKLDIEAQKVKNQHEQNLIGHLTKSSK
jgi:hypothetical protein